MDIYFLFIFVTLFAYVNSVPVVLSIIGKKNLQQ